MPRGYLWNPLTAAFFAADLMIFLPVSVLLLIAGGAVECRWGSVRMLWLALAIRFSGIPSGRLI